MNLRLLVSVTFIILISSLTIYANDTDTTKVEVDYTDGPHIFWKNDTTATVFYLCNDKIDSATLTSSDTIRFDGFCRDSNLSYVIPVGNHVIKPDVYNSITKIIAVSDIHGEYEYLVDILIKSGVIDENQNWIYGDGHLVINGDIFDRGDLVTECLWLVYRLEIQAEQNGGEVHFTLGNHELMILQNDNRYINDKYLNGIVIKTRIDHMDLFGPDMELGRWLRSKNTAIKINDILFVHGGLAMSMIEGEWDISKLNKTVREKIQLRSSQVAFDPTARMLFGSKGPFWYRGYLYEMENRYPMINIEEVDSLIDFYKVSAIVVGHTGVDKIGGLFDNKIIAIDIPFDELEGIEALLWENNQFFRIAVDGTRHPFE